MHIVIVCMVCVGRVCGACVWGVCVGRVCGGCGGRVCGVCVWGGEMHATGSYVIGDN